MVVDVVRNRRGENGRVGAEDWLGATATATLGQGQGRGLLGGRMGDGGRDGCKLGHAEEVVAVFTPLFRLNGHCVQWLAAPASVWSGCAIARLPQSVYCVQCTLPLYYLYLVVLSSRVY